MDFVKNLYRYKRLRHIAVGRHLLHDIAFSVHGLFCMEDKGLPSPGQTSSNRCRPTKLHCPTLDVSAFHLDIGAFAVARFPRHHIRDTSPLLYAD